MPLVNQQFDRVHLPRAPLSLVLAQIQFDPILAISDPKYVSVFQDAVRERYPRLAKVATLDISIGPEGYIILFGEYSGRPGPLAHTGHL